MGNTRPVEVANSSSELAATARTAWRLDTSDARSSAPERLLNLVRRAVGDRRALNDVDHGARAEYERRVQSVSTEKTPG
jgi:hypothetical protein